MTALRTHKVVAALPPVLEPSALYFVRVGAGFDLYVTNEVGLVASYKQNSPTATVAQFRNATAERLLSSDIYWAAQVPVALIDAATIVVDMAAGINFAVTLFGNRVLGNPIDGKPGQAGSIFVTGGGYSMAFASDWVPDDLATFPVLNPTGVTELRYKVAEGGKVRISGGKPASGGALREQDYVLCFDNVYTAGAYIADAAQVVSVSALYTAVNIYNFNAAGFSIPNAVVSVGQTQSFSVAAGQQMIFVRSGPQICIARVRQLA